MHISFARWLSGIPIAVLLAAGCNNDGQFTSDNGRKRDQAADAQSRDDDDGNEEPATSSSPGPQTDPSASSRTDPSQTDPSASPEPTPAPCEGDAVTKVRLLSPSVASNAPGSHLEYEISAEDCAGNPVRELEGSIDFDVGAHTSLGHAPLPYRTLGETTAQQGQLQIVKGQDLFGNTGENFQFFRSSQPVKLNTATKSVKIRFELNGTSIEPYTPEDERNGTVATYLRFGKAAPVKQSVPLAPAGTGRAPPP